MGIQINGQTDTVTATDGSINVGGDVTIPGVLTYEDVTNVDSVGIVTAQSGIHVTSGQVLVAKTTTSITTQGSRLDNGLITVSGNSNSTNLAINGGGSISLANIDSTDNNFSNIGGYNSNGLVVSQIDFINKSHSSRTGDIAFLTHNGSVMSERLRITSSGLVSIGTDNPTNAFGIDKSLHVHSSLSSGTRGSGVHLTTNASGNTANDGVSMRLVDTDLSIDNREAGLINFLTSGTERLRIKSDGKAYFTGNLGLGGQTSPASTIHINNFGNDGYELKLTGNALQFNRSSNSYIDQLHNSGSILFRMTSSNTEAMRITSTGQMGLGTNDPNSYGGSVKLAVANTSGTCGLSIVSATNGDGNLYYADGTSGDATYRGYIRYNHSVDQLRIGVGGAERFRITSDGKTGIGGGITSQNFLNVNATGSMGLYGTIAGKVGHSIKFIRKYGSSSTHNFAVINGATPHGQSRLGGFVATYTFRSAYGFDSDGGGHGVRMLSGRVRDSGEWGFDTETNYGTGDSPRPTLQGVDNNDGTCTLQVVNPGSTHSYGEFHIVAWDCVITSPST